MDEEDDFRVKSSRKSRGKGVDWLDYCEGNKSGVLVEYINLEAAQADATYMDYSKWGHQILMYSCSNARQKAVSIGGSIGEWDHLVLSYLTMMEFMITRIHLLIKAIIEA